MAWDHTEGEAQMRTALVTALLLCAAIVFPEGDPVEITLYCAWVYAIWLDFVEVTDA